MGVMIAAAAIGAAGAIYSSSQARKGAGQAATAQERAAQMQIDEQRRQYDQTRTDQMPWLQAGQGAVGTLANLAKGDYSSFTTSPDYQWALSQGQLGLDRGAAAKGRLYSGGYDADRIGYNQGMASQQFNNYRNSLQSLAGLGQSSANAVGAAGQNMANQNSNAIGNAGDARASAYGTAANANASAFSQIGNIASNYIGQRWGTPTVQPPSGGSSGAYFGSGG